MVLLVLTHQKAPTTTSINAAVVKQKLTSQFMIQVAIIHGIKPILAMAVAYMDQQLIANVALNQDNTIYDFFLRHSRPELLNGEPDEILTMLLS